MLPDHLGTTKQEAATAMRRLEETTVAAMVGWAKAATEVERLTGELEKKRAMLGHALSVPTLGDARAEIGGLRAELEMHQRGAKEARRQDDERHAAVTQERDEAKAALARVRALHKRFETDDGRAYCDGCRDSLAGAARYPCDTIRALDGSGT